MTEKLAARKHDEHGATRVKNNNRVDADINAAGAEDVVTVLITDDGRSKSCLAFGRVMHAPAHGVEIGVAPAKEAEQFSGTGIYPRENGPSVDFQQKSAGITWNIHDRNGSTARHFVMDRLSGVMNAFGTRVKPRRSADK